MQNIQPGSQRVTLNNASAVTAVTAPTSGKTRTVVAFRVTNLDSDEVTPILYKDINGTSIELERKDGLAANEVWKDAITLLSRVVLLPTESLKIALSGSVATTQPVAVAEYIEGTDSV